MNYETFKSSAMASIQKHFGTDATVSLHPVTKNNNIRLDGLTIQEKSSNISPTIYLNYYYEDYLKGRSLSSIIEDIIASYHRSRSDTNLDLSFFTDYQKVRYHIIYKLINYEKNRELLPDIPHFRFLDLAVVFSCLILNTSNGNATILIHNHHLELWNITADQLYDTAKKNTPLLLPWEINNMKDVLKDFYSDADTGIYNDADDPNLPMYVLTNTSRLYGASCILYPGVLKAFADALDSDLYILPSSIHEVLLLPQTSPANILELNSMIEEVNAAQLQGDELLSDHVYYYTRTSGFVSM